MSAGQAGAAAREELRSLDALRVPQILTAEVASALRAMVARGVIGEPTARFAFALVRATRKQEFAIEPVLGRVWELRDRVTVYDAWYVALAEGLGEDLVTADDRLIRVRGLRCRVRRPGGL